MNENGKSSKIMNEMIEVDSNCSQVCGNSQNIGWPTELESIQPLIEGKTNAKTTI